MQCFFLMQAVKEENEALKQEIEAVKRQKAEQASFLRLLFATEELFSFLLIVHLFFYKMCFSVTTGGIRVDSGRTPEQVRSITSTLIFDEYYSVGQNLMFTFAPSLTQKHR